MDTYVLLENEELMVGYETGAAWRKVQWWYSVLVQRAATVLLLQSARGFNFPFFQLLIKSITSIDDFINPFFFSEK